MTINDANRLIEQAERLNFRLYGAMLAELTAGDNERARRIRRMWQRAANRTARRMDKRSALYKAVNWNSGAEGGW